MNRWQVKEGWKSRKEWEGRKKGMHQKLNQITATHIFGLKVDFTFSKHLFFYHILNMREKRKEQGHGVFWTSKLKYLQLN